MDLMKKIEMFIGEMTDIVHGKDEPLPTDIGRAKANDKKYKAFFMKKMREWGIDSLDELSDKEKKKFFTEIENEYTEEDPETDDGDE